MGKKGETATELKRLLRSDSTFTFKEIVFFCGKSPETSLFHEKNSVFSVRTIEFKSTIQAICTQRNDSWSHVLWLGLSTRKISLRLI